MAAAAGCAPCAAARRIFSLVPPPQAMGPILPMVERALELHR
jgi:hypothetical protein